MDDKIDGVVIIFVDVSERHAVEETLRSSERQLLQQKHLIDLSRDPIFVWDFDGGILEWNWGSEQLYGYTREEAIGKTKERLLHTIVPDSSLAELKSKLLKDGNWSGILRQKTKTGQDLLVEARTELETFNGRRLVLESTRDVTAREAAERRLRLLLSELTHRVRNTLAVIQAIARHTVRNSKSMEDFIERFEGRLSALASAHTLLVGSDWKGADLGELARKQLAPHITDNPNRLRLEGDPISLPAHLATPFGLVLHELATNAAKYGSLSVSSGTVNVAWTTSMRNNPHMLRLAWTEAGGPRVARRKTSGFGHTLIENAIPGAHVEWEFQPSGLVCTIELALSEANGHGAEEPQS